MIIMALFILSHHILLLNGKFKNCSLFFLLSIFSLFFFFLDAEKEMARLKSLTEVNMLKTFPC